MNPQISILIPVLNDQAEILETVKSIRETSPAAEVQIIVGDDSSNEPVFIPEHQNVDLFRTPFRIGAGSVRHMAAERATADHLLLLDSHMRFQKDWYENAMRTIKRGDRDQTIHCGACLGLDEKNMNVEKPYGTYHGASLNLYGPNPNKPSETQIFEGVWAPERKGEDDYELSCLMGASYFIPKRFFFHIGGLQANKHWGSEEPYLALKAWLSGGEIRMMKTVKIGHKFRSAASYRTAIFWINYNKIRSIMTTIHDDKTVQFLVGMFPGTKELRETMDQIALDRKEIMTEFEYNKNIFVHDLDWFCSKFNITHPLEHVAEKVA